MADKKWYESKTKWGTILIGVGAILGTAGSYFAGNVELASTIQKLVFELGGVLAIFGIRDLPLIN